MNRAYLVAMGVLLATRPASAEAAKRIKVAVVSGISLNVNAARVDALSHELAEALMIDLDIEVIGGPEVRRMLPAEGIPADCAADTRCTHDVAQLLGADQLLFVTMLDTGTSGAIQIDSTWVAPADGVTATRPAIVLANESDARQTFRTNARRLLAEAPVREQAGTAVWPPPGLIEIEDIVPRHFTTPAKITAGGVVVGLGVAIGFGLAAHDREDSTTLRVISGVGAMVSVSSALATAALYYRSGGRRLRWIVTSTGDGGAATLVGTF